MIRTRRHIYAVIQSRAGGLGVHHAQIEGNKVVYSVVLTTAENPLNRGEVESQFEGALQRSSS